jgi:hypothetical protein
VEGGASELAQEGNSNQTGVVSLKLRRFSYGSTNPVLSSRFLARYINGGAFVTGDRTGSETACIGHEILKLSNDIGSFDIEWIHSQRGDLDFGTKEVETYVMDLHETHLSFGQLSVNNWHRYMDYHSGFVVSDCDPLIAKLHEDGVPFFPGENVGLLAIFIQDPVGITHEVVCTTWSLLKLVDVEQWDFCRLPSIEGSQEYRSFASESAFLIR